MSSTVTITDSVEKGDLDDITDLYRHRAKIQFPSDDECLEWEDTLQERSEEYTYYLTGGKQTESGWRIQCMAADRS